MRRISELTSSGRSRLSLFATTVAFLLPTAFSPSVASPFWAPKAAILLLVPSVGLPRLAVLARHRSESRLPAVAALLFLALACVSAALSAAPVLSVLGLYNWGTGALFVASLVGAWAIGVSLDEQGRADVATALLLALGLNLAAAFAGLMVDIDVLKPGREGRSAGLLGNPVHFGALLAAGVALVAPRFRARPVLWAAAPLALAAAIQLSGSRFPLLLALAVALGGVRRWPVRLAALFLALLVVGAVAGQVMTSTTGGVSGSSRLEPSAGGVPHARLHSWWSARHALAERPLIGAGPGRYRAATSAHRTKELALAEGADRVFVDAHNLIVEYAVTTGVVGLACLLAWVLMAVRHAGGSLLGFTLVILAHHLLQPQAVGITPIAFLALGAAATGRDAPARPRATTAVLTTALVPLSLAAAFALVVGDVRLEQARLDFSLGRARQADELLGFWPEPAQRIARIAIVSPGSGRAAEARRWMEVAARRDPTDPKLWNDLADLEDKNGFPGAEAHYRKALAQDPVSARALAGLGRIRLREGRYAEAIPFLERAQALARSKEIDELLRVARERA